MGEVYRQSGAVLFSRTGRRFWTSRNSVLPGIGEEDGTAMEIADCTGAQGSPGAGIAVFASRHPFQR